MKKIVFFLSIIFLVIYIVNSLKTIHDLWNKQNLLLQAKNELIHAQKENQTLKKERIIVENPAFVEAQARNKLFLTKPGEKTVFISKDLLSDAKPPKQPQKHYTPWEEWWNLFIY